MFDSGLADAYITSANLGSDRNLKAGRALSAVDENQVINRKLLSYSLDEFLKDPEELSEDEDEIGWTHPIVERSREPNMKVVQVLDFTNSNPMDQLGHGTFITSVIASEDQDCPGLAPDAEVYVFKLFTGESESYTQWFLDAFDKVLELGIDVVNLSNGGNDFMDEPFITKINQLTSEGVIVVSAIGNEGPFQGTLNNPGDLVNVIGVGSLDTTE